MALGATLYTRPRTEMDITISPTLRRRHTLFIWFNIIHGHLGCYPSSNFAPSNFPSSGHSIL